VKERPSANPVQIRKTKRRGNSRMCPFPTSVSELRLSYSSFASVNFFPCGILVRWQTWGVLVPSRTVQTKTADKSEAILSGFVWHDLFTWDMTRWRETWLVDMRHYSVSAILSGFVWHDLFTWDMTRWRETWLVDMRHDSVSAILSGHTDGEKNCSLGSDAHPRESGAEML